MFKAKAYIGNDEKFKERLDWGLEAQTKVQKALEQKGIIPIDTDNPPLYSKIEHPKPDLEYRRFFVEVSRRQEFYDTVFMGYTKKFDGWIYHSIIKHKTVFFVLLDIDMNKIAITLLNDKVPEVKTNKAGDLDYTLPFDVFKVFDFDEGINILADVLR